MGVQKWGKLILLLEEHGWQSVEMLEKQDFRGRRFSSVGALSNTEGMKEVAEEDRGGKGQGSQ